MQDEIRISQTRRFGGARRANLSGRREEPSVASENAERACSSATAEVLKYRLLELSLTGIGAINSRATRGADHVSSSRHPEFGSRAGGRPGLQFVVARLAKTSRCLSGTSPLSEVDPS
jgi:hypothetical protein